MPGKLSRRGFLSLAAALSAAGIIPSGASASGKRVLRTLGRTGLKVSEVGMGVMITRDPEVVRAALDAGVNYFDTARSYMGGRNEEILAEGLKGRRQEAVIATKCHRYGRKESIISSVEESLRALDTDVIDVLQLHGLRNRSQVLDQENLEGLETLRKSGKIRFAGVTTHSNMVEVLDAAVEGGIYDVVLTSFNFRSAPELAEAIERTAAAGLGVVAMKIMTGGYSEEDMPGLNQYQAALRWVLRHPGVSTTIPSMQTLDELEEDVAVMGTRYGWGDDLSLRWYARYVDERYCRACETCLGQCPRGVDIPTALRGVMYAEGYRREDLARETLSGLSLPCADCPSCVVNCRFGVRVGSRMAAAAEIKRRIHV